MSTVVDEILAANAQYVSEFGDRRSLPLPPARQVAILTCMDARLDPAHFAGLKEGDAHVIRNAGGRASDDAIRSLVISHKLLGTQECLVVHHTNCGMQLFTDEVMGDLLAQSLDTAVLDGDRWRDIGTGPGSSAGRSIDWLTFRDLEESVREDVRRIRQSPLLPPTLPVRGFIYDVTTGGLQEVMVPEG
ncbi:beta-class carbonic anhydrase [Deinococcus koreensis]|uniref:Carbonic anhydrase n=1 Tax=Deinococcus koreensis TaxID=2054903 RepID=A0A2K3UTD8_9DEIO|nr:carbonic anhydrase [Deinococcus koreensis]PNY79797.1 carbonic anhydrase [Deinococcus koreensis]